MDAYCSCACVYYFYSDESEVYLRYYQDVQVDADEVYEEEEEGEDECTHQVNW